MKNCMFLFFCLQGGYFFWLQMPDGALADKVAEDVWVAYKIRILPGNRYVTC